MYTFSFYILIFILHFFKNPIYSYYLHCSLYIVTFWIVLIVHVSVHIPPSDNKWTFIIIIHYIAYSKNVTLATCTTFFLLTFSTLNGLGVVFGLLSAPFCSLQSHDDDVTKLFPRESCFSGSSFLQGCQCKSVVLPLWSRHLNSYEMDFSEILHGYSWWSGNEFISFWSAPPSTVKK